MLRKVALVSAGVLMLGIGSPRADEAILDQMYGNGVHSYFGGDFSRTYESLSAAIRGGSRDPRAYYFRGLAELRLGRQPDAAADFEKGAELETADSNDRYPVSEALERIQGPIRATVEQYRENARAIALQRDLQQRQTVFDQQHSNQAALLRRDIPAAELTPAPAPDQAAKQPAATAAGPAAPKAAQAADPFNAPPAKPADETPDKAAAEKPVEATNPFGDDVGKKPAETPATPPAEKPAGKPADAAQPPADAANPFGDAAKPTDKSADKPAAKSAANSADPFGEAKPAEKPAADKKADAAADASAAAVKPQPGAVRGILKALGGAIPGGDAAAPGAAVPPKAPAASGAQATPPASAAGGDDPFGLGAGSQAKPASASPAAVPSAAAPSAVAPPATTKKAGDPFSDEPSTPAKSVPDAKAPAPTDKTAPQMKKDDDPFKN
ncbi:MAG TPA: hypothetical protein VG056_06860 [Pirellulales bacterium]|jgi:hypothetical protein|nr:hypothetical protein [Pirellulales bacterium]